MQYVRASLTAALFLAYGTVIPAYAQRGDAKQEQARAPEKQQSKPQQAAPRAAQQQRPQAQAAQPQARAQQQAQRPQQAPQQQAQRPQQARQQQAQRPQQARQQQQPQRTQGQAVAWQKQRGWATQGAWQGHSSWQQGGDRNWDSDHRTWAQRGGYGGYYIPQARFDLSFGSRHWFRMRSRPAMYMGYPRFSYGGLSFMLVDPWPESWAENWYATDDLYIDYDDGYYLYNRRYPGVGLAITVAL